MSKKGNAALDDDVRAQIQQSHNRAKYILETPKRALEDQAKQLGSNRIDISNLFTNHSLTLPTKGHTDSQRRSASPGRSFNPINEDMHSTRKSMATEEANPSRHRSSCSPDRRMNRGGGNPMDFSSANRSKAQDLTIQNILANSRSERVKRLSHAPHEWRSHSSSCSNRARLEQDEKDFIAEIPEGFQPNSPPTCEASSSHTDSARVPIDLDDFGGGAYLLKK